MLMLLLPRMCAGSALQQEYRQEYQRCLEQDFHRGHAETSSHPSLSEQLRQRLRQEPAVLGALQEDGPILVAHGLQGHPDPELALQGLAAAFQLLERAAVNLYLFPWRKEFSTIQTFSGAYVHSLRPVLPEADLLRSFGRLGYDRCDQHRLTVRRPLPGPDLLAAACGFLACRLECEILAEVVAQLRPRQPRARELLEARRLAGAVEACVEMLQWLGTQPEAGADCGDDSVDLYQEMPTGPDDIGGEDAAPWRDPGGCDRCECRQEPVPSTNNPKLDSTSHFFLEQELGGANRSSQMLGEAPDSPIPQEAPELPCYQLHSCLRRGTLPSYCCTTCQQLHAGTCAAGLVCRSQHHGQELRSERQQRLWLRRTEVDMLLADSSGPWS
ncbi:spermatogenesis-associated protein 2-like protein [Dryobates pubescens]|uniref:spermatogenesis-associated protein 2-like protein n=1 Tax=Dryobates pubescens TaxID=118200 RepID=UPI0023B8E61C|nr:spermatogenesis-associated protein 2-like protein [Dryobates pubescens]